MGQQFSTSNCNCNQSPGQPIYYSTAFKSMNTGQSLLDELMRSARNFGIVYSREMDEALDKMVATVGPIFETDTPRALSILTNTKITSNTGDRAFEPLKEPFAEQPRLVTSLQALSDDNAKLTRKLQEVVLLLALQEFRIKTMYNSAVVESEALREPLNKKLRDLFNEGELQKSMIALEDLHKTFRKDQLALRISITAAQNGDPEELVRVKKELSVRTLTYCEETAELQSIIETKRSEPCKGHDRNAIHDCVKRLNTLDADVENKLSKICKKRYSYQVLLEAMKGTVASYVKHGEQLAEDLRCATSLAALGGAFKFFKLPAELRNMVYEVLLKSDKPLVMTKYLIKLVQKRKTLRGKHDPQTNSPLFAVSSRFRQEAAAIFYSKNTFTCRSNKDMGKGLGLKILPFNFIACLSSLALTWHTLGDSTVQAEKLLSSSLPVLKSLTIYICFDYVLGVSKGRSRVPTGDISNSTSQGVEAFKRILTLQNSNGPVQVRIYDFIFKSYDAPLYVRNYGRPRGNETDLNDFYTNKLVLGKKCQLCRGRSILASRTQDEPELMEKEKVEEKLEEALTLMLAEKEAEV